MKNSKFIIPVVASGVAMLIATVSIAEQHAAPAAHGAAAPAAHTAAPAPTAAKPVAAPAPAPVVVAPTPAPVETKPAELDKEKVEKIIHDYLVNNPEVLVEASRALQTKQRENMMKQAKDAINQNIDQLFKSNSPTVGSATATATVVEFFDYQCGVCKQMTPVVKSLASSDKAVRIVYKQLPIFGETSEYAAKAALAANLQGKYAPFHAALMAVKEPLSQDEVLKVAAQVGLNVTKLKTDMQDPRFEQELKDNVKLAENMGIMGTPAFVIGSNPAHTDMKSFFIPGATSETILQSLVNQVR